MVSKLYRVAQKERKGSGSGSGSGSILHKLHDWDVNMQAQSTEQYA